MPFTAPYALTATFAKPLLAQAVALIQRDQAAAIAIVNQDLLPINEFHLGPGARTAMPWLSLTVEGETFDRLDDLSYRAGWVALRLDLDVGQYDQEIAQLNAHDYVRVLDMILSSAGPHPALQDWTTALPVSLLALTSTVLTVTGVAVGTTAVYTYSAFTGPSPQVGMKFTFSGFAAPANNGAYTLVAVSGGASGTVTVALGSQTNETPAVAASATNAGTTTPPQAGTVKEVLVASHRFSNARLESHPAPILVATLGLAIRLIED